MNENKQNRIRVGDHVTIYVRGKKKTWTAEYWHNGKHCRKSLKTSNLRIARQRAVLLDSQMQQGLSPIRESIKKGISIQQASDDFLTYKRTERLRPKSIAKYKSMFNQFIPFVTKIGVNDVASVDLSLIDQFRQFRHTLIGGRSMHNDGVNLRTFLAWCAERKLIAVNPLGSRRFRRPKSEPLGGPTLEQVDSVLAIADRDLLPIIAVAAFTGHRSGDVRRLTPEDVDLKANWIHFASRADGLETKTGNTTKVPIHPRLRRILESLPRSRRRWYFTARPSAQYPDGAHHLNTKKVNERFQRLLKILDIPAGKKPEALHSTAFARFSRHFVLTPGSRGKW